MEGLFFSIGASRMNKELRGVYFLRLVWEKNNKRECIRINEVEIALSLSHVVIFQAQKTICEPQTGN